MSSSAKVLVLRQHDEVWSRGNLAAIDEIYAPDFIGHHPGAADWIGRDGVKEMVTAVRRAFPDFVESVEEVLLDGDRVVTRFRASGTHRGPWRGMPATGRTIHVAEMAIFRVSDNRIAEKWGLVDRLGMVEQLGLSPTSGPRMDLLYKIEMDVEADDLGVTPLGRRRIVRVNGGTFEGSKLRGTVLPGGGDWLVERQDGVRSLDVRITLRTDDGQLIYAHYPGLFHAQPAVMQRLARGEDVGASEYYFRTAPLFETASEKYGWLNRVLGIGVGRRTPGKVSYTVYSIL